MLGRDPDIWLKSDCESQLLMLNIDPFSVPTRDVRFLVWYESLLSPSKAEAQTVVQKNNPRPSSQPNVDQSVIMPLARYLLGPLSEF